MVLLVTLWFVSLPFSFADLWWQHHWGLGPFDVAAWLAAQWSTLAPEAVSAMATIVLLVGLARPLPPLVADRLAGDRRIAVLFAFVSGWLGAAGARPLASPQLRSDVARIEQRRARRAARRCASQDVSSWTNQANAFTVGFGPATHVGRLEHAARRPLLARRGRCRARP